MRKAFLGLFALFGLGNYYHDALMCAYYQGPDPVRAKTYCLRALDRKPSPRLYEDTVNLLLRLNDYEKALELAREFNELYPEKPKSYIVLYRIYKLTGRGEEALETLKRGYGRFPDDETLLLYLVDELLSRKRYDEAKEALKTYIREKPDRPLSYYLLGRVYLMEGNPSEGVKQLRRALEVERYYTPAVLSLGRYYETQKKFGEALQELPRRRPLQHGGAGEAGPPVHRLG